MALSSQLPPQSVLTLSGLDRLLADTHAIARLADTKIGLLTNHASLTTDGVPASLALQQKISTAGGTSIQLFTPEHGIELAAAAGDAVQHSDDPLTGLSVRSLYGGLGLAKESAFDDIDTLVIDLRDVGVRCYTYAATAARAAQHALDQGTNIIICDRANPLGPGVAGPRPEESRHSLIAFFDVPFVHGQTLSELLANHLGPLSPDKAFEVYPADPAAEAALGWTPPSPALSHPDAVSVYAGLVLLEATNISEGRGSSVAFRSVSAPGLNAPALAQSLTSWGMGYAAAPAPITTMQGAHAGQAIPGIVIWPRKGSRQVPLELGVRLLAWLRHHHPDFAWLPGSDGTPGGAIDTLFGRSDLREQLEAETDPAEIIDAWR